MKRKLTTMTAATFFLALGANACTHGDDDDDDGCYDCHYEGEAEAHLATIDADYTLSTDLGLGSGTFVEYSRGGLWTVWTSCDTDLSGLLCFWDVYVTSYGYIDTARGYDLEGFDYVDLHSENALDFHAETGSFSDALEFTTAPGELVEVSVYLDGWEEASYLMWHGNGRVQAGAPHNPVLFQPDAP